MVNYQRISFMLVLSSSNWGHNLGGSHDFSTNPARNRFPCAKPKGCGVNGEPPGNIKWWVKSQEHENESEKKWEWWVKSMVKSQDIRNETLGNDVAQSGMNQGIMISPGRSQTKRERTFMWKSVWIPSNYVKIAIESGPCIVDLHIYLFNIVVFHSYVTVYQRVPCRNLVNAK